MIRVLKSFAAKLWLALILLIIIGGTFIGTTRLLLPLATEYRQEVEELVSKELGQKVEIGQIKTSWRGYGPELVLSDVLLIDPGSKQPSLRVSEIHIGIGLLDSLRNRSISPRQITFYRTRMLIKRRSDGSVVLAGLEGMEDSSGDSSSTFLLPFRIRLKDSEVFWENQSIGAAPVRFTNVDFTITNGENRHQIQASMRLPGKSGGSMQLIADIHGNIQVAGDWSGEVYLTGSQLAMSTILKDRMPEGSMFETGQANMELWSSWEQSRITNLQGQINLQDLKLISDRQINNARIKPVELERLGGSFNWQRNAAGWMLDVADIEFKRGGEAWPKSNFSMVSSYDRRGHIRLRSGVGFVRIKDLLAIIGMFPLPSEKLDQALNAIQPKADLHSLQLNYQETPEGPLWSGRGQLKGISIDPWQQFPGISHLNAKFWLDQDQGTMELEGNDFTTDLPQLFRNKIQADELSGRITWKQNSDKSWVLESKRLSAKNQDIKTETRIRVEIPSDPKQSLFLDLQSDFRDGNASATSKYLPTSIMPDDVVQWLDQSIISGRVLDGSAIFRGPIDAFPFYKNSGHFEVLFRVDDAVLNYDPEWPQIKQLAAELRFHNNSLDIWASKGRMLNSRLHNVNGRIDDLENASPLKLTGKAHGPFSDELKLLTQTPLAKDFAVVEKILDAKGDVELALKLKLPLDEGKFSINGKLGFKNSSIFLKQIELPINKIQGKLAFNQNGVKAKGLKARVLGEKIKLDITPLKKGNSTLVQAYGPVSIKRLNKHFPNLDLDILEGKSNWKLRFEIPSLRKNKGKMYTRVTATSDLIGTAIKQPTPIGKGKKQKRNLRLSTTISDNPNKHLKLDYGNVLNSDLYFYTSKTGKLTLNRGSVVLGGGKAKAPKSKELVLSGKLKYLDLSPWLDDSSTQNELVLPKIRGKSLSFGKLKFGDTILDKAKISFSETKHSINGKITSSLMDGAIKVPLPFKSKPIIIDLKRLTMKLDPDKLSEIPKKDPGKSSSTDPRTLPAIILSSKSLTVNRKDFGPLKIITKRIPEGLKLEQMKISSKRLNMSARGSWTRKNNQNLSRIRLKGKTDSLGKLLTRLGFAPNLKKAPAEIEANLTWSGNPRQFNNTDVSGRMKMEIGKGRFLEVNPGLGRVFGLLNISALQRRLTLDFSDTFKKGFSFDKAEGSFQLDSGDAYTNDLRLEGPAALIEITGRTGLVDQDFDQLVTVTPSISTAIPVAGALAGGPAVGAALLLVQKLIGRQVDKVSTTRYTITGPWDNANIVKLKQSNRETNN